MKRGRVLSICILVIALVFCPLYEACGKNDKGADKGRGKVEDIRERAKGNSRNKGNLKKEVNMLKRANLRENIKSRKNMQEQVTKMKENVKQLREINRERKRMRELLDKKNNAKWSHNPNDERGQGNMGRVDMIAPLGHDKAFDRKSLFGNNGRVVRKLDPNPIPVPLPEPILDPEIGSDPELKIESGSMSDIPLK